MSITDANKIDGIGISNDGKTIILLLSDHLKWKKEYKHLMLLQEKINSYIFFLENKQYEEIYKGREFQSSIIEIHFEHGTTEKCLQFLQVAQNQVAELGIRIEICE